MYVPIAYSTYWIIQVIFEIEKDIENRELEVTGDLVLKVQKKREVPHKVGNDGIQKSRAVG